MSNQTVEKNESSFLDGLKDSWNKRKALWIGGLTAAALVIGLAFSGGTEQETQDTEQSNDSDIVEVVDGSDTNADGDYDYNAEDNVITVPDVVEPEPEIIVEPEPEPEPVDTVIDSAEEVLDLLADNGLTDVFVDEVKRLNSDNISVTSQATKDIGHYLANGKKDGQKIEENDTLANQFFQASYDMDGNVQAAHSIGYQALHGIGMDGANLELAETMLTEANDAGHPLAADHLNYLYKIK